MALTAKSRSYQQVPKFRKWLLKSKCHHQSTKLSLISLTRPSPNPKDSPRERRLTTFLSQMRKLLEKCYCHLQRPPIAQYKLWVINPKTPIHTMIRVLNNIFIYLVHAELKVGNLNSDHRATNLFSWWCEHDLWDQLYFGCATSGFWGLNNIGSLLVYRFILILHLCAE